MIFGFINKTDLTWQDRFPSDPFGLWVVFFCRVASGCSQRKALERNEKLFIFRPRSLHGLFGKKQLKEKEAEHLQHVGGDKNAPTVATGGLYLKGAGQSAALFMQGRLSSCSASHHRCAPCWLSVFILFARSDFLRQPDDLSDPCVPGSWGFFLPGLFQFCSIASLLLIREPAELTLIGSGGTWLNLTGRGQIKILC